MCTLRRGQAVNQTFRHPDSASAAMSIIGQERERREASGRRVPHGQKGGRPSICHQSVLWRGEARNISESSPKAFGDTPLILWSENFYPSHMNCSPPETKGRPAQGHFGPVDSRSHGGDTPTLWLNNAQALATLSACTASSCCCLAGPDGPGRPTWGT